LKVEEQQLLVIRFARTGKKNQAYFRIVVAEKQRSVSAKFIEILGNYDPHAKKLSVDADKLKKYMANGAVPSNSVAKLLKLEKIDLPKWVKIETKNKASKKKEEKIEKKEAPKAVDEEKPAEEGKTEETPAEESKQEKVEAPKEGDDKKDNNPQVEEAEPEGEAKEGE
jgi:small subunit ribosomal protein S16